MEKALLVAGIMMALFAASVSAQPLQYDLYYGLPGSRTLDVGINSSDISSIADVSLVPVMAKTSISDMLEVGVNAQLGVLIDGADALNNLLMGASTVSGRTLLPPQTFSCRWVVPTIPAFPSVICGRSKWAKWQ